MEQEGAGQPVILAALAACAPALSAPPPSPGATVTALAPFDDARALLGLDRAALLARLGATAADAQPASYGPAEGLERVYVPTASPARLYLSGGKVVLAYFSGAPLAGVDPATLAAAHPAAVMLPSRAGKLHAHHVDAPGGFAWSDDGEEIAFIEVFAPTNLPTWTETFYQAPGPFIK